MKATRVRATAVLIVVGALVFAGCGSSGDDVTDAGVSGTPNVTATTTAGTSTTEAPTTTSESGEPAGDAVWPTVSSSTRFTDPVAAATDFATTFLGFVDPIVGAFQQGDNRSGEVAVQASDPGPTTTVIVRQLGSDHSWWVLGATTPNLQIATPDTLATVTSPLTVGGRSTAFEGTIDVEVRADDQSDPLAADHTMGGSMGDLGPFSIDLTFPPPTVSGGAIVVKTMSARDGNIAEASVIRVHF